MGLRETLEAARNIYPGTVDGYMRKMDALRDLERRAPELAQLVLDMGEWIRCDLNPDTDTLGCSCKQNPDALLARLDQLGKADSPSIGKEQT